MKKINILIVLGLLILLFGMAQPVHAANPGVLWAGSRGAASPEITRGMAQLNSAISKFEGLLNAYSVNQDQNIEEQLLAASNDLSDSLEEFNSALAEVYPTLTEEQEPDVVEAYSSLRSYLEDLATKANLILQGEEEATKHVAVLDGDEIAPGLPGQMWVSSYSVS